MPNALEPSKKQGLKYHSGKNNDRCKSLINSKTISVSKKFRNIFAGRINSKKHNVRMKLQTSQILQIFIECRNILGASVHISKHSLCRLKTTVRCRLCAYPSIHLFSRRKHSQVHGLLSIVRKSERSLFRLKITVACPPCTYPSIHPSPGAGTLKITVGCLTSTYPSIRNKNLQTCWTPWSTQETRGLWALPPVLSPVPVQAIHSRALVRTYITLTNRALRRNHLVSTLFEAIEGKKAETFLSLSGSLGRTHRTKTTDT